MDMNVANGVAADRTIPDACQRRLVEAGSPRTRPGNIDTSNPSLERK